MTPVRPDDDLEPEQHDFLERLARPLRAPVELSDRVERTVLAHLRADRSAPVRRFRALGAAAMAACIALAFAIGWLVGRRGAELPIADRETRTVEFVLRTAADSAVTLVGDFNDWDPRATPLHPASDGVWTVTVPLRPGRYRYTFIVDGTRWRSDPAAPRALEDDFGTPTSVITVAQR
jgi:hypothetical protein